MGHIRVTRSSGAIVTVRLRGAIDAASSSELRRALVDSIVHRRARRIVVDLSEVTEVDSTGIGMLAAAYGAAADIRSTLVFRYPGERLARQLMDTGVPVRTALT